MTLTTHAIFGAGLASLMPEHPVAAFIAGFASHFVLDAIPHWDYAILSESVDPNFGKKIIVDRTLILVGYFPGNGHGAIDNCIKSSERNI